MRDLSWRDLSWHEVRMLADRELGEAWRNRTFLLLSAAFAVLALAMSWLSLAGAAGTGFASLGRSAASLIGLVVLIVPLMGLSLGAGAIAGERERGSWLHLLAQPVSRLEVALGKLLGLAAALAAALGLGFGAAALVIARAAGDGGALTFLAFLGLTLLMATASLSLGLLISATTAKSTVATGAALFAWLALVLLGDLGLLGTSFVLRLDARELLALALVNPLQEFKLAAVLALRGSLEVLGPAGLYATRTWGGATLPMLAGGLLLWTAAGFGATLWLLHRRPL